MRRDFVRPLLRLSLALALALGAGACSTISDTASDVGSAIASIDPTGLLGDDGAPPPDQTADSAPAQQPDDTQTSTPNLASLPPAPVPQTTASQDQQMAGSLQADRAQVQYSADALRGGTEASAPPPPPPGTMTTTQAQQAEAAAPPPATPAAPEQMAAPAPPAAAAEAPAAAPPSGAEPPGAEPAVPMNAPPTAIAALQSGAVSDASLGFKASAAPALDPSISQWVPGPIIAHYQQTAANAGVPTGPISPVIPINAGKGGKSLRGKAGGADSGGTVVAHMDAVSPGRTGVYANMMGGAMPTAVVYFPGDGTTLNAAARTEIHSAVTAFKASGSQGAIRVVGHASSRTANMPVEKHLMVIFQKSQARANAVATELIREGVPADKVLVEAVGDSQPVYYESMPKGEDGNRRTEIFVQG